MKPQEMIRKANRTEDVANIIKRGISHVIIENPQNATPTQIREAYKKLLENHITDKQMLEIMVQESNMKKLATRLEHRIEIRTQDNKLIGTYNTIGTKTTHQVSYDIRKTKGTKPGENIRGKYPKDVNDMKNKGYEYTHSNDGTINKIIMEIIFRKG